MSAEHNVTPKEEVLAKRAELIAHAKALFEAKNYSEAAKTYRQAAEKLTYSKWERNPSRWDEYDPEYKEFFYWVHPFPDAASAIREIHAYLLDKDYDTALKVAQEYQIEWNEKGIDHQEGLTEIYSVSSELNYLSGLACLGKNTPSSQKDSEAYFNKAYDYFLKDFKMSDFLIWYTDDYWFELGKHLRLDFYQWEKLIVAMRTKVSIPEKRKVVKSLERRNIIATSWDALLRLNDKRRQQVQLMNKKVPTYFFEQFYGVNSELQKIILDIYKELIRHSFDAITELDIALQDRDCASAVLRKDATYKKYPNNLYATVCLYNNTKEAKERLAYREAIVKLCSNKRTLIHTVKNKNTFVESFFRDMVELSRSKMKDEPILSSEVVARVSLCLSLFGDPTIFGGLVLDAINTNPVVSAEFFIDLAMTRGCPEVCVDQSLHIFLAHPIALESFFGELAKRIKAEKKYNCELNRLCEKTWEIVSNSKCHEYLKNDHDVQVFINYRKHNSAVMDIVSIEISKASMEVYGEISIVEETEVSLLRKENARLREETLQQQREIESLRQQLALSAMRTVHGFEPPVYAAPLPRAVLQSDLQAGVNFYGQDKKNL